MSYKIRSNKTRKNTKKSCKKGGYTHSKTKSTSVLKSKPLYVPTIPINKKTLKSKFHK